MRPPTYTEDEIVAAGNSLLADGREVTSFALRNKLGGGNATRLKQIWDGYRANIRDETARTRSELPTEVTEKLASLTRTLLDQLNQLAMVVNDEAVKTADRRVAEASRAAEREREVAKQELADASEAVDKLENALQTARNELASLSEQLADRVAAGQAQAIELAQLRERMAASEAYARAAMESQAAALAASRDQVEEWRVRCEAAQLEAAQQVGTLQAVLGELEAKTKAQLQGSDEQKTQASREAARLHTQLTSMQTEMTSVRREAENAGQRVAELEGKLEVLRDDKSKLLALIERCSAHTLPAAVG